MISTRPIRTDNSTLLQYQKLFDAAFGVLPKFKPASLEWLYDKNPTGRVFGFDAYDGDLLVAHYACIPTEISYQGVVEKALLSLNTATHPDYQGRGLFTKLAEQTYTAAAEAGYSFVYGVANANSTPGFLRKLGFSLLEPLLARLFLGNMMRNLDGLHRSSQFFRVWDARSLAWRLSNPENPLRCQAVKGGVIAAGNTKGMWLPAQAELPYVGAGIANTQAREAPVRLFLGLLPVAYNNKILSINIPDRIRPSPLNFIYKDLTGKGREIRKGEVLFTFIDFDAY